MFHWSSRCLHPPGVLYPFGLQILLQILAPLLGLHRPGAAIRTFFAAFVEGSPQNDAAVFDLRRQPSVGTEASLKHGRKLAGRDR